MKNLLIIAVFALFSVSNAQEIKPIPQIAVSGEGKVKVSPDQVYFTISVENKGSNPTEVKKSNDVVVEKVIQYLKKIKLPKEDFKTKNVSLNPIYDYDKKKQNYSASQSIEILLKDIKSYDSVMQGLVDAGITRIDNVEFKSSKIDQYISDARKLAMKDAKQKADDYVFVLGQKVGKALTITDNSQGYYPQPIYETRMMKATAMADDKAPRETLAAGEINITANVNVIFVLE